MCMSIINRDPVVTGTSVVALKYADGVMIIADTLSMLLYLIILAWLLSLTGFFMLSIIASYGSMPRFKSIDRIRKVTNTA
jgi:hypothetical protein